MPWSCQSRAMLTAPRNSQDFACCARATVSARSKYVSACDEPSCGNLSAISPVTRWISASYQRSMGARAASSTKLISSYPSPTAIISRARSVAADTGDSALLLKLGEVFADLEKATPLPRFQTSQPRALGC